MYFRIELCLLIPRIVINDLISIQKHSIGLHFCGLYNRLKIHVGQQDRLLGKPLNNNAILTYT